ncbi:MAG: hypothetical protein IT357_18235 [Gemmatimonadaceae bacterium]|nr:hypothetical protein [Gemmatimonadaceae bacterium]
MLTRFRSAIVVAGLVLFATESSAQAPTPSPAAPAKSGPTLGFALDASFEFGGDDFLEVVFTSGDTQKIKAGQGGTIALGGILRPNETSPLSLRGTLGFKFVSTAADNANIMFTRIPIELVGGYDFPNGMRVGAGLSYHMNNKFNGDGFVPDATFDPAAGFTAEIGYKAVALTYTALNYKADTGESINGGSIGVQLLWTPKRK